MKTIQKELSQGLQLSFRNYAPLFSKALFLDIETTGFHREHDSIFLLGYVEVKANSFQLTQLFCEKDSDEYELLHHFNELLLNYDTLLHFNGTSFDLPFLQKRMQLYRIHERISQLHSYDFFHGLRPMKGIFKTDNYKLRTLEKIAGFKRHDLFDGQDLVSLYKNYREGDLQRLPSILLHNEEDLYGLISLLVFVPILQYLRPLPNLHGNLYHKEIQSYSDPYTSTFHMQLNFSQETTVYAFERTTQGFTLSFSNKGLSVFMPLQTLELKHFFDDYKSYYYLPVEDYAIHHSLATFLPGKNRKKATKETAYMKKEGTFIGYPLQTYLTLDLQLPVFKSNAKDTMIYLLIDDVLNLPPLSKIRLLTELAVFLIKESKIG